MGKPKGMLQILWERGFIDETKLKDYTISGKKDAYGSIDLTFSLKYLLSQCTDFAEEESLLQSMGRKMGVTIDQTPKCHEELAGEGIKYTWGYCKNHYRRMLLALKRSKTSFRKVVSDCCSREKVTKEVVRKFSKRARQYILAYYAVTNHADECKTLTENGNKKKDCIIDLTGAEESTVVKVEQMKMAFKTHRCAMDFDADFIKSEFTASVERVCNHIVHKSDVFDIITDFHGAKIVHSQPNNI